MPYLQRDASGRVIALLAEPAADATEFVSGAHSEVRAFLNGGGQTSAAAPLQVQRARQADPTPQPSAASAEDDDARRQFAEMDGSMIRVIEDLLDVLIGKHLILLTDLPMDAQRKLLARKETRRALLGDAAGMSPPVREIF